MIQKIYNALRQCQGYTKIDVGDGFIFTVWFDWTNQPYADLSDCEDDRPIGIPITCVLNQDKFEETNHREGFKREGILLTSIKSIGRTPIEKIIAA